MEGDIKFWVGFGVLLAIVLAINMLVPRSVLPERSVYLMETLEMDALEEGRVVVYFFYNRESLVCESQAKVLDGVQDDDPSVVVQWFNMDDYPSDRRLTELADQYQIEATPAMVVKNVHHDTTMVGFATKTEILVEINKLKTG